MAEQAAAFNLTDHGRISRTVLRDEQGLLGPARSPSSRPDPRGLVRVMWLGPDFESPNGPQTQGDFPLDSPAWLALITEPLDAIGIWTANSMPAGLHYMVRCAWPSTSDNDRTWQLRVMRPRSICVDATQGMVTEPISENATGQEVADAINATGCPAVQVAGSDTPVDGLSWPPRVWHIYWPGQVGDPDSQWWFLTTTRSDGLDPPSAIYAPGDKEVAIQLIPTGYQPTPFCESISLPYQHASAPPLAGSFALCQVIPGRGLVVVDQECWQYPN